MNHLHSRGSLTSFLLDSSAVRISFLVHVTYFVFVSKRLFCSEAESDILAGPSVSCRHVLICSRLLFLKMASNMFLAGLRPP